MAAICTLTELRPQSLGSCADRRSIEMRARERGLKVLYIDPEGWWVDDEFFSYPLESPQKDDLIYKKSASDAFYELSSYLFKRT